MASTAKRTFTYHIGLRKEYDNPARVIVQMARDMDLLDRETWRYMGPQQTTKGLVKGNRYRLLDWINQTFGTAFTEITVE